MKKWYFLTIALFAITTTATGQRPKLDLKAYVGVHTHIFKYKDDVGTRDVFYGWQGGFGFRVTYRKVFGEIGFNFIRNETLIALPDSFMTEELIDLRWNSFELPLKVGVVPIKRAFFKWYVYTGLGFRMNTKGRITFMGETVEFKPKEIELANPNIDWILGTQVDLGSINIDFIYNLGVTNSIRRNIRANSHELHLNVGFWF